MNYDPDKLKNELAEYRQRKADAIIAEGLEAARKANSGLFRADPLDYYNIPQLKCRVRLAEADAKFKFAAGLFFGFLMGGGIMILVDLAVAFFDTP